MYIMECIVHVFALVCINNFWEDIMYAFPLSACINNFKNTLLVLARLAFCYRLLRLLFFYITRTSERLEYDRLLSNMMFCASIAPALD